MGSAARSTRSNAAPAGRQSHEARSTQRPPLHVVSNRSANGSAKRGLAAFWAWTKSRSTPLVHIVVAVVFLGACLLGALLLRTQMSSNSFEASRIEQHITMLQQDVEDDQARLAQLEATLPERAQKMNMEPAKGSLSIDLQGYQPAGEGAQ
ncbi:MAG: hypothetical protein HFJ39_01005 [Bifidobacterium pseudolongum]|jgi:hypothetical protein|uniref:Uncharacterized protein n=1 Tax=Bifidobacterium pseudolongum TaxID=1694 RepID=A0A4V3WRN3_9BIFI|nr:hypothetical protein [Bifidobacterium pseudolongum]MCI8753444.1 hypothetical protein [Bifidobacterium pseudolongum]THG24677.1 hypothetical protein E5991_07525 [Bifidobacterium pseudolongum]